MVENPTTWRSKKMLASEFKCIKGCPVKKPPMGATKQCVSEEGKVWKTERERERVYKLVGEKKRTSGVWAREYEWSYSSANSLSATMTFQFSCCPSVNNVAQNLNTLNSAQDQPLAIGLKVYKATGMNLLLSCTPISGRCPSEMYWCVRPWEQARPVVKVKKSCLVILTMTPVWSTVDNKSGFK